MTSELNPTGPSQAFYRLWCLMVTVTIILCYSVVIGSYSTAWIEHSGISALLLSDGFLLAMLMVIIACPHAQPEHLQRGVWLLILVVMPLDIAYLFQWAASSQQDVSLMRYRDAVYWLARESLSAVIMVMICWWQRPNPSPISTKLLIGVPVILFMASGIAVFAIDSQQFAYDWMWHQGEIRFCFFIPSVVMTGVVTVGLYRRTWIIDPRGYQWLCGVLLMAIASGILMAFSYDGTDARAELAHWLRVIAFGLWLWMSLKGVSDKLTDRQNESRAARSELSQMEQEQQLLIERSAELIEQLQAQQGQRAMLLSVMEDYRRTQAAEQKARRALKARTEKLELSNQELDTFAHIASHDLKEPLRGIANYCTFLLEDYSDTLDNEGVTMLQSLARLSQLMEKKIQALFTYSRLGQTALTLEPVDLNKLVTEVIDNLTPLFQRENVHCRVETLPITQCDRTKIAEVFSQLIVNAIIYNDNSRKVIDIGVKPQSHTPEFFVRDEGIGIKPEVQSMVFNLFKRLHTQQEYGGGVGAGLTIARKIIHRHGGTIRLESSPNEGSTFYFTLSS